MSERELSRFRVKTQDMLRSQADQASNKLGGFSLIPDSIQNDFLEIPEEELRKRYPNRYDLYKRSLRSPYANGATFEMGSEDRTLLEQISRVRSIVANLNLYLDSHYNGEQTLRGRQVSVFEDIRDFIEDGNNQGYVKLPTGTGKTVLFTEVIEAMNVKTLVVVPKNILIQQTEKRIGQFAKDLDIGKINEYTKQHGKQVTITTYDSFVLGVEEGTIDPTEFDLLILDEAHRAASKRRVAAVNKFNHAIKLSFSATLRKDDKGRPVPPFGKKIHSMDIIEGVGEELLSPFSAYIAKTQVDLSNVKISTTGDYDPEDLDKHINTEARNQAAVDLFDKRFRNEKGIAYCNTIRHAENVASLFNARGIKAVVISGEMSRREQRDILQKYHDGEYQLLCNADILIEGFDEPSANICINLRPTLSALIAEQRGGRVLRVDPNNSEKQAYIIDILDENSRTVTFAEVANGAEGKPYKQRNANYYPTTPKEKEIQIEGLEVITEVEEVMNIVRKKAEGEQKYQTGFSVIPTGELREEFSVPSTTFWKIIQRLKRKYPEHFMSNKQGHPALVTGEGMRILRDVLTQRESVNAQQKEQAESHSISISDLSREYGILHKTVRDLILRLQQEGAGLHYVEGDQKTTIKYFASNDGEMRLRAILTEIKKSRTTENPLPTSIPEGFVVIPTQMIKKEWGIPASTYDRQIYLLKKKYPEAFISRGGGLSGLITQEALQILLDKLNKFRK